MNNKISDALDINMLPQSIAQKISGSCVPENIGRSGDDVFIFDNSVLKISSSGKLQREADAMSFLGGKITVPQILAFEQQNGCEYLLMSRLGGTMMCYIDADNRKKAALLAGALKSLLAINCNNVPQCLCDAEQLDLDAAEQNIKSGKVPCHDLGGFCSTDGLYRYLCYQKPQPEYFTHGDFCLPNILYDGENMGFIDLGGAGMGGKWRDIAMCIWSMRYNFEGQNICGFNTSDMRDYEREFFYTLQTDPDEQSINYYLLLGLLF